MDADFCLPGLQETPGGTAKPDVVVRHGSVPATVENVRYSGPTWRVAERHFLLELPGVVRLFVQDGTEIVVEPAAGMSDADVAPFVLSTGLGAILHQRGHLILHAAAVERNGRSIALCAPSGAGKSTLAAALCRAGCTFVSDDIVAVRFGADQGPIVLSDGRQHRLWGDAVDHLALADRLGAPVRKHLRKFHVHLPEGEIPAAVPLTAVLLLGERSKTAMPAPPEMMQLNPVDAAPLLRAQVYRGSLGQHMGKDAQLFGQIATLMEKVPIFQLERTLGFDHLEATVATVLAGTGLAD